MFTFVAANKGQQTQYFEYNNDDTEKGTSKQEAICHLLDISYRIHLQMWQVCEVIDISCGIYLKLVDKY